MQPATYPFSPLPDLVEAGGCAVFGTRTIPQKGLVRYPHWCYNMDVFARIRLPRVPSGRQSSPLGWVPAQSDKDDFYYKEQRFDKHFCREPQLPDNSG